VFIFFAGMLELDWLVGLGYIFFGISCIFSLSCQCFWLLCLYVFDFLREALVQAGPGTAFFRDMIFYVA